MSLPASPSTITYLADNFSTNFAWPYYVVDPLGKVTTGGDLVVTGYNPLTEVLTAYKLNSDYSFLGTPDPKLGVYPSGGTIVFGSAPASPLVIRIARHTPLSQLAVFQPNDPFPAGTMEESIDRLVVMVQDILNAIGCVGVGDGPPLGDGRTYIDGQWIKNANMTPGGSLGWMYLGGNWYLLPSISN